MGLMFLIFQQNGVLKHIDTNRDPQQQQKNDKQLQVAVFSIKEIALIDGRLNQKNRTLS